MPKGPVETPITDQEIAFAHLILAGRMTDREAAENVGISPGQAGYVKAKPRVKEYMEQHRASVRAGLVQHEVDSLAEFNIGREQILAKWWEFANIHPEKTGFNTSSQSKALDYLWNAMGYADSDPKKPGEGEGDGDSKPQFYRAAWIRKPGDPDYEDTEDPDAELGVVNPEPTPTPERPAVLPQAATVRPSGDTINRAFESTQPSRLEPRAGFGRFQGLGK